MPKHLVILRCSRTTAIITIAASICLFILIGCASLFRSAGLTDQQAAQVQFELKTALSEATADAITDIQISLAEGHDLKTIAVKTSTAFLWKIIAAAGATVGVVLNGLLAKWLSTEKKINKALITGVEFAKPDSIKETIQHHATLAGVENKLNARVKAFT